MLRACLLCILAQPLLLSADDLVKPDKLSIHTWVREDFFGGWIGNDNDQFELGVRKLDRYLVDHPDDKNALSWKYLQAAQYMIQARAKGDAEAYRKNLADGKAVLARIFPNGYRGAGPLIIVSASVLRVACVAPVDDQGAMFHEAREMLAQIPEQQGAIFDKMPAHMRGELWAQLAFVANRLGNKEEQDKALDNILTRLPDTPYAARAKAWQKEGALAKEKDYTCLSCHEPGRLAPSLAKLNQAQTK